MVAALLGFAGVAAYVGRDLSCVWRAALYERAAMTRIAIVRGLPWH